MMLRPAFLFLFVLLSGTALAQSGIPVRITVHTAGQTPIAGARVAGETLGGTAIAPATTDSSGIATVQLLPDSSYLLALRAPGYTDLSVALTADSAHAVFTYVLQKSGSLSGITVTADRPLIRQVDDMTIVDPTQLALSSANGYEVLEKVPGIIADQDGNFFLTSSTPATIYINGRELKMSTADVATMLRALPPGAIERVEILRTPSARYDASGSGGILNVVLKKGVKLGTTGSVNAGIQQGMYGNRFGGASVNYNDGETTAYLNVSHSQRKNYENIETLRDLEGDSSLAQDSRTIYSAANPFTSFGASRSFGKKWTLSYDGRVGFNAARNRTANQNSFVQSSSGERLSGNGPTSLNRADSWNIDQSLNAKYLPDTLGSEWTIDLNWNGNFSDTRQDIYAPDVLGLGPGGDTGTVNANRHYLALKTDLKLKLPWKLTLEAGAKNAYSAFRSDARYMATVLGRSFEDPNLSNAYRYRENIGALYVQASREFAGITVKPGLRLETTYMAGRQTYPGDTSFRINRADLFPYLYISRNILRIAKFDLRAYLIYRRTILRPSYDYLNPYLQFIDAYTYNTGNPALRPQFTQNVEANISVDDRPVLAIGRNDVTDIFSQVVYQSEADPSVVLRTYDNLGRNQETYIRGLGAIPPGGTYFFVLGGQININRYTGLYQGAPIDQQYTTYSLFTYHLLKLGKMTNFSLNGFARFKGFMQFYELGPFGQLNASLSRYLMNRKLIITASVQDMFYTNQYTFAIDQGPVHANGSRYSDSRRFGLQVRYNFGIRKEEKKDMFDTERE